MKLLVDMNLTPRWVPALRVAGFTAVHWSEVGAADAPDGAIVSYAREHGFSVLTHDLDFGTILALTNWNHPSVVQLRADDTSPEAIGSAVLQSLVQAAREIEAGALLTVEP